MSESISSSAGKLGSYESIEELCLSLENEKYFCLYTYKDALAAL